MKKYILFLIGLCVFAGSAYAQSLFLTNFASNHSGTVNDANIDAVLTIENHSTSDLNVIAERVLNDLAPNHLNNFCYGIICYPPTTSISPTPEIIVAGGSNTTFKSQLLPMQAAGVSEVKYCFYDQNNVTDSVCVRFVYDVLTVGVEDVALEATFSRPSPNPANAFTAFSYDLKNNAQAFQINVYNMLGSKIKTIEIPNRQGVLIISTSELENGIYFCSLVSEGKAYHTQKLMVSR